MGFRALAGLVARLRPQLLLHGHIHPYGAATPDRRLGDTVVRNVVGRHLLDITPHDHAA
jgi:Icc-related predicted phosphoesterase